MSVTGDNLSAQAIWDQIARQRKEAQEEARA